MNNNFEIDSERLYDLSSSTDIEVEELEELYNNIINKLNINDLIVDYGQICEMLELAVEGYLVMEETDDIEDIVENAIKNVLNLSRRTNLR